MVEKTHVCTNQENSEFNNTMKGIARSNAYTCVYNVPEGFLLVEYERLLMVHEWYGTVFLLNSKS